MFINTKDIQKLKFLEIRKSYAYYRKATKAHLEHNPSDHYRVDRSFAIRYFSIFPKWRKKIIDFTNELKKNKKDFSYVDVCGRASGVSFGANLSFLFSLKTGKVKRAFSNQGTDIFIDGDIFNPDDFNRLLDEIRSRGVPPALITFRPMAGLQSYTPFRSIEIPGYEAITYTILYKRLAAIFELLLPGGFIMIERPFQFDGTMADSMMGLAPNQYKISVALKKIARKLKCKIEIGHELGGPYFLLQKNKK